MENIDKIYYHDDRILVRDMRQSDAQIISDEEIKLSLHGVSYVNRNS